MYYLDHEPPHFHAEYGEYAAVFEISTLAVISGRLPARATGLVVEWALMRQKDLMARWKHARQHKPLKKIEPLP
jgi:hypothetical protein